MVQLNWTKDAQIDLAEIGDYISKESGRYAELTVQNLYYRVDILKENPRAGKVVPEFQLDDIRELIEGSYRIVYHLVSQSQIDILTVHHSARLLRNNPRFKMND